jgi:hypothetical protein
LKPPNQLGSPLLPRLYVCDSKKKIHGRVSVYGNIFFNFECALPGDS